MVHLYLTQDTGELERYRIFVRQTSQSVDAYIAYLRREMAVDSLPRAILWTSRETATTLLSDIPIPAYTNDYRVVMTPDLDAWRDIYLRQLRDIPDSDAVRDIRIYYQSALNHRHVLQILGHELAHHSEFFPDDFDSALPGGIWFEEGMAEYISRRFFLTDAEFNAELDINRRLVELNEARYGSLSLESFGVSTYEGDYAGIFYWYWRSFLAVNKLVQDHGGSIHNVFRSYHRWISTCKDRSLSRWFGLE